MAERKTVKKSTAKSAVAADKLYSIVSKQNGKAIEAGDEDVVCMMKASRRKNQQWSFQPTEDGCVKAVNAASGKVLDVVWEGTDNGAQIHQWEYMGGSNQQWMIETTEDGACKIKGKASQKCIDIVDMSSEDGARLQIWDDCNGDNQQWILKEIKAPAKSTAKTAKDAETVVEEKPKKSTAKAAKDAETAGEEKPKKAAKPRASKKVAPKE